MKRILMLLIIFYQKAISPFFLPSCRFVPSCSEYSFQAVKKYGALKGTLLTVWRVLRCNPFNKGGYDPLK